jgi:DNA-binding FadR family transcriptional regulator
MAEATQNLIIPALIDTIIDLLREQRMQTGLINGGLKRGQFHHREILEAVVSRDPIAARNAMQRHLEQVRQDSGASPASAG